MWDYDNALIYKEISKRNNDNKLVKRDFQLGKKVLLYNDRFWLFPGKLKSKWSGLFIITKVFSSGAIEI